MYFLREIVIKKEKVSQILAQYELDHCGYENLK